MLHPGAEADAEGIIRTASARLAGYKKPRSVSFVEALPLSATGKVLKRELRLTYWQGRERVI